MMQANTKPSIVFFGTPEFAIPALETLTNDGYVINAVVTAKEKPRGRGLNAQASPVQSLAEKYGITVLYDTENLPDAELFVIAAYGKIIPEEIINKPKYGTLNVHPSLLPKYRGPSPMQTAIANGDTQTGVTIMLTDEKMDHGPILAQRDVSIEPDDTGQSLSEKLAKTGGELLVSTIPDWCARKLKAREQNHKEATYTKLLTKETGRIDWSRDANSIERIIRAYHPWPGAWTMLGNTKIKILKAHVKNACVVIDILQPEGRKQMTYAEFCRGYTKGDIKFT